jgi:hypothetical protein
MKNLAESIHAIQRTGTPVSGRGASVSKLFCMPLPDGRWLVMDQTAFTAALAAGAELMPPSTAAPTAAPLFVDAAEMARITDAYHRHRYELVGSCCAQPGLPLRVHWAVQALQGG